MTTKERLELLANRVADIQKNPWKYKSPSALLKTLWIREVILLNQ